jgi:hypothetical protein
METLAIISRITKQTNIDMINKLCDLKNIYGDDRELIMKEFIKPNYYNISITKYAKNQTK